MSRCEQLKALLDHAHTTVNNMQHTTHAVEIDLGPNDILTFLVERTLTDEQRNRLIQSWDDIKGKQGRFCMVLDAGVSYRILHRGEIENDGQINVDLGNHTQRVSSHCAVNNEPFEWSIDCQRVDQVNNIIELYNSKQPMDVMGIKILIDKILSIQCEVDKPNQYTVKIMARGAKQ